MRYNDTTEDIKKMIPGEHYRLIWDRGGDFVSVDAVIEFICLTIDDRIEYTVSTVIFKTIMLNDRAKGEYRLRVGKQTSWRVSEGSDVNYFEDL